MNKKQWMIYGANGYTGSVVAELAAARENGLINKPILAGRSEAKIKPLAQRLGLDWRVFDLQNPEQVRQALLDIDVLLHCAGPFSATSSPMVEGCIASHCHYLDITGEYAVLEAIKARSAAAQDAGISLIPAVGFDVVPTDCLANILHKSLPDATQLEMAFCGDGGASPGTVKTMIEMLGDGGRVREDGVIRKVPGAYKQKSIRFSDTTRWCMSIPWGDISSAYTSTGIANITIYTAVPKVAARLTRISSPLMALIRFKPLQNALKKRVEHTINGPNEQARQQGFMRVWGKVINDKGECREAWLDVAEGYQFTAMSSLSAVERLLAGGIKTGTQTPAQAFGDDFVLTLEKSQLTFE